MLPSLLLRSDLLHCHTWFIFARVWLFPPVWRQSEVIQVSPVTVAMESSGGASLLHHTPGIRPRGGMGEEGGGGVGGYCDIPCLCAGGRQGVWLQITHWCSYVVHTHSNCLVLITISAKSGTSEQQQTHLGRVILQKRGGFHPIKTVQYTKVILVNQIKLARLPFPFIRGVLSQCTHMYL